MNQPLAMTEADARRYRFLMETPHRMSYDRDDEEWFIQDLTDSDFDAIKGWGVTAEDAIDDLMRQLKWEPKS